MNFNKDVTNKCKELEQPTSQVTFTYYLLLNSLIAHDIINTCNMIETIFILWLLEYGLSFSVS